MAQNYYFLLHFRLKGETKDNIFYFFVSQNFSQSLACVSVC